MSLTCIIVDDEQPARKLIAEYVKKTPQLTSLGEFKNPLDAMNVLASTHVDILFLDIQMPGITGLEFIKTLNQKPDIILTTAYSEYALEGFELDVTDYLMKPISFERFLKAVNKASAKTKRAAAPAEPAASHDHMLIKSDGQVHRVRFSDILYIEGLREYVSIQMAQRRLITLESLRQLEQNLSAHNFLRVHKSFIVNTEKVDSHSSHNLTIGSKQIPIGASYREEVLSKLFQA